MKMNKLLAVVCMSVGLSMAVQAEDQKHEKLEGAGAGKADKAHTSSDMRFLEEAAKGGMAEVKVAELATQKAESSSVKQFAERLHRDHSEANQKMQQLVSKKGLTQPTAMDPQQQKNLDHLNTLSGAEFDREFIQHSIKHHRKDIKEFEKQGENGEDPAIRSFAREILPTLREHLKIAEQLKENPSASIPELSEPAGAEPGQGQDQQDQSQQQGQQDPQSTQP